jgi:hypothetical protein
MMYELTKLVISIFDKKKPHKKMTREQRAMEKYLSEAVDHVELEYRYKQWDRMNSLQGSVWRT